MERKKKKRGRWCEKGAGGSEYLIFIGTLLSVSNFIVSIRSYSSIVMLNTAFCRIESSLVSFLKKTIDLIHVSIIIS